MTKTFIIILFVLLLLPAQIAHAQNNCGVETATKTSVGLKNPLGSAGICSPEDLVMKVLLAFSSIMGVAAVAFTVFSGFKLTVATNEESRNEAKEALKWSVGGFIVSILSFTVISGAAQFIGFNPSKTGFGSDTIQNPIDIGDPARSRDFAGVMLFVMVNFLGLVGFASTLVFIYYGYIYITAAGNEESIEKAKSGLKWSILGLAVTLLAFTVITAVRQYLIFNLPK